MKIPVKLVKNSILMNYINNKMKDLLKQFISKWACHHEWERWNSVEVRDDFGGCYHVTHFVCTKCGKFKKVKSH